MKKIIFIILLCFVSSVFGYALGVLHGYDKAGVAYNLALIQMGAPKELAVEATMRADGMRNFILRRTLFDD